MTSMQQKSYSILITDDDMGCRQTLREIVEPGVNGLVEPFFDVDRLTETALKVLDNPADFAELGRAGRHTIEQRYGIESCIPPIQSYFERVSSLRCSRAFSQ